MNFRLIAKILGGLLFLMGLSMASCAGYAWYEMRQSPDLGLAALHSLGWSAAITVAIGLIGIIVGRGTGSEVLRREAIVVVGLGWLVSGVVGSLPYWIGEPSLSMAAAIFESMSGITTTGSTAIPDLDIYPRAILLWRCLSQWLGGIGIVVLFVAVLAFLGVGSRSLMQHESSLNISDSTAARIRDVAKTLLFIYVGLTMICGLGLWVLGMTPYEAACHAMTTISTGGFSTENQSIGHWDSLAMEAWITLFMFLGSVSFMIYVFIANRRWARLKTEEEARYYFLLLLAAWIAVAANLWLASSDTSFLAGLRRSFFTIVSISTTTGFGTEDYDQWPTFSRLLLLGLMAVGGCAGSTAGGVKMNRLILFAKISVQELVKSYRPHQVFRLRLNGATPNENVRFQTTLFLSFAFGTCGLAALAVSLLEPHLDLTSSFGAVLATLFNIGPGMGMVGPTDNFASLHPTSLLLLSLVMALGRLEFFAILVLFVPSLWRRY